jgi:hypothetical protein
MIGDIQTSIMFCISLPNHAYLDTHNRAALARSTCRYEAAEDILQVVFTTPCEQWASFVLNAPKAKELFKVEVTSSRAARS